MLIALSLLKLGVGYISGSKDVTADGFNNTTDIVASLADLTAAVVGVICAIAIYFVYRYNKKIAIQINSSGLMVAAKDNLPDVIVTVSSDLTVVEGHNTTVEIENKLRSES